MNLSYISNALITIVGVVATSIGIYVTYKGIRDRKIRTVVQAKYYYDVRDAELELINVCEQPITIVSVHVRYGRRKARFSQLDEYSALKGHDLPYRILPGEKAVFSIYAAWFGSGRPLACRDILRVKGIFKDALGRSFYTNQVSVPCGHLIPFGADKD